ncbi:uncharacterized protein FFFS_13940 [Fusarium fujikuroi]
MQDY